MAATLQSLGIDRLTADEQLALAQEIWDHLVATGHRPPLGEARLQELRRRVAEDDTNPDAAIPWEQVKAQALGRINS